MSGGVDSSVSAALLQKAGYDVTGVFIKVWQPDFIHCTWKEDRRDAMRVAALLDIPFLTLDLEKEYKKEVVDYMLAEYKAGRTPNPDVMCNQQIKFGAYYRWALKQGADYVATGHYARVTRSQLFEGKDKNKDQSYFLWTLTKDQLAHILFPIGDFKKEKVRQLAKKFKLPNAEKKDSQGLCFIGKVDMKEFLSHFIKPKAGKVVDEEGNTLGDHNGAFFFTIGERHGFNITKKSPKDKPYYVIGKDLKKNLLIVSDRSKIAEESKKRKSCSLSAVNWIENPTTGKNYTCRIRYRQEKQKCTIKRRGKNFEAVFAAPQTTLASGQSLVLYEQEKCLGGGVIEV